VTEATRLHYPDKLLWLAEDPIGTWRHRAVWGGRSSSKSHSMAGSLVQHASARHLRVFCVRDTQNSIKDSNHKLLTDKIRTMGLDHLFDVTDLEIRGPNESLFVFHGLQNSGKVRSSEGFHVAWVEEAHQCGRKALEEDLFPTIRREGSEVWLSFNYLRGSYACETFVDDDPPDRSKVVKICYSENAFLPATTRAYIEDLERRKPALWRHLYLGEDMVVAELQVFPNARVERFETPPDARLVFGADFGSVDPCVLVRGFLSEDKRTLFVDHEAAASRVDVAELPQLYSLVPGSDRHPIYADSAGTPWISHLQRHGYPNVRPVKKRTKPGESWVMKTIRELQLLDAVVIHERCRFTSKEFLSYEYKTDAMDQPVEVFPDADNHSIDSVRYLHSGLNVPGFFT
ncbi:MAG: PBSX family phage terminase large subunit, partial [Pseudomonadales bacterium]|nr:PBSX family phage terminase large subunit [Pseudomonadales bacterium]